MIGLIIGVMGGIWGIIQYQKVRLIEAELSSISEQIEYVMKSDRSDVIKVPSDNEIIKKLIFNINLIILNFSKKEIEIKKQKTMMLQVMTNVSHDLRTPLTVLLGYIEILNEKSQHYDLPEDIIHIIEKLMSKISGSVRLVSQFFNMMKIESGDMEIELEKYDINIFCKEIMLEYYEILCEKGYRVVLFIPEYPILLNLDKNAVIRIVKNLVDNVIKHGYEGKYLGISVIDREKEVLVEIEDHGKGIKDDERENIFNRAYMLDKQNKDGLHNSGLGLSISKNLARKMNGDIKVISVPYQKTVFTWRIKK